MRSIVALGRQRRAARAIARAPAGVCAIPGLPRSRSARRWRPLASIGALLCIAPITAGCTAAATAALNIAGTIAVKAFDLDTAVINDIKARRDAAADPNMNGGQGEAFGSPGALPERPSR